jgi:phosphopantothenoylcysteine decarboxylase/phosphopantothenate--cysteine ligase
MLKGKTVLLGITGGIAAYKSADLVSKLKKADVNVDIIMTEAATKFVTPLTFQTMSQNRVHVEMFGLEDEMNVEHISLAQRADVILIAPASANTISKIANGIADNLLTTTILASKARIIFAPAMNSTMYLNEATVENIEKLKSRGHIFLKPGEGRLACGDIGPGKMSEPIEIIDALEEFFTQKDFIGKKVIITAGPTIEPIDPVRYITNHSSGKMGYSLAKEFRNRGAEVILVTGPSSLDVPLNIQTIRVNTTLEMLDAVKMNFEFCDILIKSAAPSDYRVENYQNKKIKKSPDKDEKLTIDLVKNPDIAKYFGEIKRDKIMIGFAAETNNLIDYAKKKLIEKNFDFIVANNLTKAGAGFKEDTNIVTIIHKNGEIDDLPIMKKALLSKVIADKALNLIDKG